MHRTRVETRCAQCLAFYVLSAVVFPASAGEAPVHRVQPAETVVLHSPSSEFREFFIGESAEPTNADLHLLYTGDRPFKCKVVLGGNELPPASFGMRYGDGWLQVGADGGASGANGRRFALRQALTQDGKVEWAIDQSLSAGEECGIFEKVKGEWVKTARIVCGTEETPPAKAAASSVKGSMAPAKERPPAAEAVPQAEVAFTSLIEEDGGIVAGLNCPGLKENTVVQGELVPQHSGLVSQRVAGLVPADKTLVLRFLEPFLGWSEGRYIVQISVDGKLKARNTIDLSR